MGLKTESLETNSGVILSLFMVYVCACLSNGCAFVMSSCGGPVLDPASGVGHRARVEVGHTARQQQIWVDFRWTLAASLGQMKSRGKDEESVGGFVLKVSRKLMDFHLSGLAREKVACQAVAAIFFLLSVCARPFHGKENHKRAEINRQVE